MSLPCSAAVFVFNMRVFEMVLGGGSVGVRCGDVALHRLVAARRSARRLTPMPPRPPVDLVVGGALRAFFLGDQGFPVGDRDLIIVGMNFAEREEAVAVAAVVDEGGLQRRLNARHFRQIDIAAELLALRGFKVEFFDAIAAQNDHPGLLGMGRVDEHFVGHW